MKEVTYKKEELFLSEYAKKSIDSIGRAIKIESCPMRTEFQRDRDRIIHSKSFRRLKNKTQVFLSPSGDHYRTRLTHTLEVSQIARSICRVLALNEDLAEAISLGHDLGHTPFGHEGERALKDRTDGYFEHAMQSIRVVRYIENDGEGLNLTFEVEDGIANHQTDSNPKTLEAKAVCLADKIAYINHDIDDAIRGKIITKEDLPKDLISILGSSSSERINTMIYSIYKQSFGKNCVEMQSDIFEATYKLRQLLFERVYFNNIAKKEEAKANLMVKSTYDYLYKNIDILPQFYKQQLEKFEKHKVICDYISSMTDRYAIHFFESIFIPKIWELN